MTKSRKEELLKKVKEVTQDLLDPWDEVTSRCIDLDLGSITSEEIDFINNSIEHEVVKYYNLPAVKILNEFHALDIDHDAVVIDYSYKPIENNICLMTACDENMPSSTNVLDFYETYHNELEGTLTLDNIYELLINARNYEDFIDMQKQIASHDYDQNGAKYDLTYAERYADESDEYEFTIAENVSKSAIKGIDIEDERSIIVRESNGNWSYLIEDILGDTTNFKKFLQLQSTSNTYSVPRKDYYAVIKITPSKNQNMLKSIIDLAVEKIENKSNESVYWLFAESTPNEEKQKMIKDIILATLRENQEELNNSQMKLKFILGLYLEFSMFSDFNMGDIYSINELDDMFNLLNMQKIDSGDDIEIYETNYGKVCYDFINFAINTDTFSIEIEPPK